MLIDVLTFCFAVRQCRFVSVYSVVERMQSPREESMKTYVGYFK